MKRRDAGYTLVEVIVAAGVLAALIAGATAMAVTVATLAEGNARTARLWSHQEQAARLYQLGFTPDECVALLPGDPAVTTLAGSQASGAITGIGNVEVATFTMTFTPSTLASGGSTPVRTRSINVYRPSTR